MKIGHRLGSRIPIERRARAPFHGGRRSGRGQRSTLQATTEATTVHNYGPHFNQSVMINNHATESELQSAYQCGESTQGVTHQACLRTAWRMNVLKMLSELLENLFVVRYRPRHTHVIVFVEDCDNQGSQPFILWNPILPKGAVSTRE